MNVVITNPPRAARQTAEAFAPFGVATAHEAQGRGGLMQATYGMREKPAEKGLVYRAFGAPTA